jgi:hypothetical protein
LTLAQLVRESCAVAYGIDQTVFAEDVAGDLGAPTPPPKAFWLSPDVDIPAHTGRAVQGPNDVRIRVHTHEEPILDEKIVAEVYVGSPGFVLSPTVGTKRIDGGSIRFRPPGVAGTEPVANEPGATLTFSWTPSASAADLDGPGHHCLILRAFPESVSPPSSPFDVPNEQHEVQHNIEILTTTTAKSKMSQGGAGVPGDPRKIDKDTGLWWERFTTLAGKKRGKHFVVWAFDPEPGPEITDGVRVALKGEGFRGFAQDPPGTIELDVEGRGQQIDPRDLLKRNSDVKFEGLGRGLFNRKHLLGAASMVLGPRSLTGLILRFDHSNLRKRTAAVLHGVQWNEQGEAEGGMTLVALAPTDP